MGLRKIKIKKREEWLAIIFVLFLIGSIMFSPAPLLSIYSLIKIIEFVLLGLIIFINRKNINSYLLIALPSSIIFESVLAMLQFVNKGSLNGPLYFLGERAFTSQTPNIANVAINGELLLRPYSTFSHPNVLAGFLVLSMTILILLNKSKNTRFDLWIGIALFAGIVGLFLTFSRAAIVTFVLALFLILIRTIFSKKINKASVGLLAFAAIIFFSTIARFRFVLNIFDSSVVDRKDLIVASFRMIKDNPFFGVGLNNFLPSLPKYFVGRENIFYIQPVHNVLILLIAQIGIIPSAILVYFLIRVFIKTNFLGRLLIFEILLISLFDHYFLTIQQGQLLLVLVLVVVLINDKNF